jgi:hypothetical protein
VGAGGAGGIVAKELSTSGFQVVVLEQGPYLREEDFVHDELKQGPSIHRASGRKYDQQPRAPAQQRAGENRNRQGWLMPSSTGVVWEGTVTSPGTIGAFTRLTLSSAATGDQSPAPVLPIAHYVRGLGTLLHQRSGA